MSELLNCPFCGSRCVTLLNGGPGNHYVRCDDCLASSNDVGRDLAVELWNRRVPALAQAEQQSEIERLRANAEYWRLLAERREARKERSGLDIPEAGQLDAPDTPPVSSTGTRAQRMPDRDAIAAIINDRTMINDEGFVQNSEFVADIILALSSTHEGGGK